MTTLRRARLLAGFAGLSLLALSAACTGRNDGRRDAFGGASMGAGGPGQPGPEPGQSTDTTTAPAGATAPAAGAPAAGAPAANTAGKPDGTKR